MNTPAGTPLSSLTEEQIQSQLDFWQRHADNNRAGAAVAPARIAALKAETLRRGRAALAAYYGKP